MFFRILIVSIVLIAVNAAAYVPGLGQVREWAPAVSGLIGLYFFVLGFLLRTLAAPEARPSAELAPPPATPRVREREPEVDAHLVQFLGLLQEKGRFLDFVMDDISGYSNDQVGAAARVVHQGCSRVVRDSFSAGPVHPGEEGSQVTLESGYNAAEYRAVGKLAGSPPFQGTLLHKGWKVNRVDLPRLVEKKTGAEGGLIIAPAEVEVQGS